ncbi:MAG: hypothetical protein AAFX52_01880 [Pseudomonadota bacterium]
MTNRLHPAALSLLFLAACGDDAAQGPSNEDVSVPPVPEGPSVVRSSITLGTFEGAVTDLALYEAPAFGFQGAVIAANDEAGIAVIRVDGGEASGWIPDPLAQRIDVTYAIDADAGSVLALSSEGNLTAYALDGTVLGSIDVPGGTAQDVCASGNLAAILVDGDIQIVQVGTDNEGQATLSLGTLVETGSVDGCDATGSGFFFTDGAAQPALDTDEAPDMGAQDIVTGPVISSGGKAIEVSAVNGMLAVNGTPLLVQTSDDRPLLPRLVEATGGNYGGVLRDGAILVLDDNNALHVIPWSGAATAAGLAPTSDSKRPAEPIISDAIGVPFATDPAPAFTPELERPQFEDVEPPAPPGQ